jgi:hypothetical protein
MKDFFSNRERYYENFANAVYRQHKKLRYGISTCKPDIDVDLATMRRDLVEWQSKNDSDALCSTNISYTTWLPVSYTPQELERLEHDVPDNGPGYVHSYTTSGPTGIGLGYQYGDGTQNIIQVNTGGCLTRINLNPAITVNNGTAFQFSQGTPLATWIINHNLGYIPNVWEKDLAGNNIEGTLEVVDNNNIKIHFSSPVAGVAYLS